MIYCFFNFLDQIDILRLVPVVFGGMHVLTNTERIILEYESKRVFIVEEFMKREMTMKIMKDMKCERWFAEMKLKQWLDEKYRYISYNFHA